MNLSAGPSRLRARPNLPPLNFSEDVGIETETRRRPRRTHAHRHSQAVEQALTLLRSLSAQAHSQVKTLSFPDSDDDDGDDGDDQVRSKSFSPEVRPGIVERMTDPLPSAPLCRVAGHTGEIGTSWLDSSSYSRWHSNVDERT